VTKKAFYRAAQLRVRDVFDLAVVMDRAGEALRRNGHVLATWKPLLRETVKRLTPRYRAQAATEIALLPGGERYLQDAPAVVAAFVERLPGGG